MSKSWAPCNAYVGDYDRLPLLLPNSPPVSLSSIHTAFLQSLRCARLAPASGPLHMLLPLNGMLFLQLLGKVAFFRWCSNVTFSDEPSLPTHSIGNGTSVTPIPLWLFSCLTFSIVLMTQHTLYNLFYLVCLFLSTRGRYIFHEVRSLALSVC